MKVDRKQYFPPLRKNFYRPGGHSVLPENREMFRTKNQSNQSFCLSVKSGRNRDLAVSPRFLNYHMGLVGKSRVLVGVDKTVNRFTFGSPISIVKLHDYELENWRN